MQVSACLIILSVLLALAWQRERRRRIRLGLRLEQCRKAASGKKLEAIRFIRRVIDVHERKAAYSLDGLFEIVHHADPGHPDSVHALLRRLEADWLRSHAKALTKDGDNYTRVFSSHYILRDSEED